MMGSMATIQSEHKEWLAHNFPDQKPLDGLLGMMEEVGEIAHACLKFQQGIRGHATGDPDKFREDICDGLGDLFIFMCSFATSNKIDLEYVILKTWEKVKHRDWQANPETGGE